MFQSSMRIYHLFEYLLKPPVLQTEYETPVEQSIHYIRRNYNEPLNLNKLAEIADEIGYSSSSSFINMFVKKVGYSPKQYRKFHQSH
mgnify:CR=1 FL=1